jgi:hypothetical protein
MFCRWIPAETAFLIDRRSLHWRKVRPTTISDSCSSSSSTKQVTIPFLPKELNYLGCDQMSLWKNRPQYSAPHFWSIKCTIFSVVKSGLKFWVSSVICKTTAHGKQSPNLVTLNVWCLNLERTGLCPRTKKGFRNLFVVYHVNISKCDKRPMYMNDLCTWTTYAHERPM